MASDGNEPFYGPTFQAKFLPPAGAAVSVTGIMGPGEAKGWDRCQMADQVVPGFARITHGGIKLKADRKAKPGSHGANPSFHGLDPQPIGLEVRTYSDFDRERLAIFARDMRARLEQTATSTAKQNDPVPVSINHPSLSAIGITTVVVIGMSPLLLEEPGRTKMTFELLDWLPTEPESATITPKTAARQIKNARTGNTNPPPTKQAGFGGPPAGLHK